MSEPFNVLFVCSTNSVRSVMAEAVLARAGAGRFRAFSAGSNPAEEVHPLTLRTLESFGYPASGFVPKSWEVFTETPEMDFIFTVCDEAAGEACPIWPGQPASAHWGIEDPSKATGRELEVEAAFNHAFNLLHRRVSAFAALPFEALDHAALHSHLHAIGRFEGSTLLRPAGR